MDSANNEDLRISTVQLFLKIGIIFALYKILSFLPPLQTLMIPNVGFTPEDLIKVIAYGFIAATLFVSRTELSERAGKLASEEIPVSDVSRLSIIFFAIFFIYFGLKDFAILKGQKPLGENVWFLWGSLLAMSIPILCVGLDLYNHAGTLSRLIAVKKLRTREL